MSNTFVNVAYLEDEDFDREGVLKYKPPYVVCMIFGNYCGHCVHAKPEFQKFANAIRPVPGVEVACIQTDGQASEQALANRLSQVLRGTPFRGVPMFIALKDGVFYAEHKGPRTEKALLEFVSGFK